MVGVPLCMKPSRAIIAMSTKNVKFIQAIVCEDIRSEADGRFSLMGVLTGEIHFVSDVPTDKMPLISLAFYVECEVINSATVQFRFVAPDNKTILAEFQGDIPCPDEDLVINLSPVPLMRRRFKLQQAGAYKLMGRELGGRWACLKVLQVSIDQSESGGKVSD